jgi:hypothetical protein
MSVSITTYLSEKIAEAAAGVDFSRRHGARCPCCGLQAKIHTTKPWDGSTRIRYHHCRNVDCLLAATCTSIKSVETE